MCVRIQRARARALSRVRAPRAKTRAKYSHSVKAKTGAAVIPQFPIIGARNRSGDGIMQLAPNDEAEKRKGKKEEEKRELKRREIGAL